KLIALANQSYCAVKKTSPMLEEVRYYAKELFRLSEQMLEEVRYYAKELFRLSEQRQTILDEMVELAQPLPEYD
nr:hypothetical protein [Streptococcus suis]